MAFRFSLDTVLKHRKRQEEIAHRTFLESQSKVEECLRHIEHMYKQIDDCRIAISEAEKSGTKDDLHLIRETDFFIEGQKRRIQTERLKARELIRDLEEKEEALLQCLHDRQIMEKLKEKKFEEYKEHMARLEQKELDDLTNARIAGGRR